MVWFVGWILLIALATKPSALDFFIGRLKFHRRLDFFVVLGFFALLGLGFFNYSIVKKMEIKLEKYVRKDAIEGVIEKKNEQSAK